jgi:hypothetical protein
VDVAALEIVLHLPRASDPIRVHDLPTRRLTGEHVAGPTVLDRGFAGIDGAIDAAHTDGRWTSGETAAIRVASGRYDVKPGERVRVTLMHTGTNTVLTERVVTAAT